MARRYQLLWEQLKRDTFVSIEIPRAEHDRVLSALKKESAKDIGFRFKCVEIEKSYTIENSQLGDLLQLRIEYRGTMPDSFIVDPDKYAKQVKQASNYETRHLSTEEKAALDAAAPPPSKC